MQRFQEKPGWYYNISVTEAGWKTWQWWGKVWSHHWWRLQCECRVPRGYVSSTKIIWFIQNHSCWHKIKRRKKSTDAQMSCEKTMGVSVGVCWPVRCPHKGVGRWGNGGRAEVGQFDLTQLSQQDVTSFHISEGSKKVKVTNREE